MSSVRRRLASLERALGPVSGPCECKGGERGIGPRLVVEGADWVGPPMGEPDDAPRCARCGRERKVVRLRFVEDWRGSSVEVSNERDEASSESP